MINYLGNCIRDGVFMPLSLEGPQQVAEQGFVQDFWDKNKPVKIDLPAQSAIRERFISSVQQIQVQVKEKIFTVRVHVIEPKGGKKASYQMIHCLGNASTVYNNIMSTYPFLAAFVSATEEPGRFIQVSQYEIFEGENPYRPSSLQEAGLILAALITALEKEFGPIDVLAARSLGTMVMGACFESLENAPSVIYLDRGPVSIEKVLASKTGGRILHYLMQITGWDSSLDQNVLSFHQEHPDTTIITSGLEQDHIFPAGVHLSSSSLLENSNIIRTVFDFSWQELAPAAQHGIHDGHLNTDRLVSSSHAFLERGENIAEAIVRVSLAAQQVFCEQKIA